MSSENKNLDVIRTHHHRTQVSFIQLNSIYKVLQGLSFNPGGNHLCNHFKAKNFCRKTTLRNKN